LTFSARELFKKPGQAPFNFHLIELDESLFCHRGGIFVIGTYVILVANFSISLTSPGFASGLGIRNPERFGWLESTYSAHWHHTLYVHKTIWATNVYH
jgi:hypothetical protein